MSRKLFLIIIVIAIISLGVGLYFFFSSSQNQSGGNITSAIKDFFPFGKGSADGNISKPTPEPEPEPTPGPEPIPEVVKLHQLSTNPVSGYALFDKERYVETAPLATEDPGASRRGNP
jgi:flagellar basal body-associated protein FliL